MCSDALGKIASHLTVSGNFPTEFGAKSFAPIFRQT
jgi:hypothetical protein